MVKDHTNSESGNPLPPHGLLFPISSKGSFICTIPQTGQNRTYNGLWYTSRGALAGTRNSSMGPLHEGTTHRTMSERSYHRDTSRSLLGLECVIQVQCVENVIKLKMKKKILLVYTL